MSRFVLKPGIRNWACDLQTCQKWPPRVYSVVFQGCRYPTSAVLSWGWVFFIVSPVTNFKLQPPVALPPLERVPCTHFIGGCVPQSWSGGCEEHKNILLQPAIEPRLLGRPTRNLVGIPTELPYDTDFLQKEHQVRQGRNFAIWKSQ
jgi:hypothetical protein